MMRKYLTLLILPWLSVPTFGEQMQAEKPRTLRVCEEVATVDKEVSICTKPCTSWASSQPDPQYSFDACVANCRKQNTNCSELPVR